MVDNMSEKKGFLMRVVAVTVNWQLLRLAGSCGYKCGNYAVFLVFVVAMISMGCSSVCFDS